MAVSLSLQADPFDDRQARPLFAGLLPEDELRRLIPQQLHVPPQNDFALLGRIGGECARAVTLMAPGQAAPGSTQGNDVRWFSDEDVAAILEELPRRPMLAG